MSNVGRELLIGIDPGTGVSSGTGYAVIEMDSQTLIDYGIVGSKHFELAHRIQEISNKIEQLFNQYAQETDYQVTVCIEQFVMRGKSGETLQRLIGSIMGRVPMAFECRHVQNTTVKLLMAGHGHADKYSVAAGAKEYFNKSSQELIKHLILTKNMDIMDAIAIGVSGWIELSQERAGAKPKRRAQRKKINRFITRST